MKEDKFVITPIKDSKKINKVLANDTARQVLDLLSHKPMTLSQISEKMKIPPTTIDYSIKQLESVGLIKSRTGFNKNHRIAKYYEPQEKFIILAPGKSENVIGALKNMLPAISALGIVSALVEYFYKIPVGFRQIGKDASGEMIPAFGDTTNEAVNTVLINPHYGILLFAMGFAVILFYALWKSGKFSLRNFS
jgi:DNA-binding transcriptional ArsR family regulator